MSSNLSGTLFLSISFPSTLVVLNNGGFDWILLSQLQDPDHCPLQQMVLIWVETFVDNVDKIYYFLFELQSDLVLFVEGRMASNIFQSGVL